MGIDYAYFAARDDASAAESESRPGGPLGWPVVTGSRKTGIFRKEPIVETLGPDFDGFHARGYDPMVNLGTLEALLRGVKYESLQDDPRWGGSPSKDERSEDRGVITLTDTLRDALARAAADDLRAAAEAWGNTEERRRPGWEDVTAEDHVEFLRHLRQLSVAARDRGDHLYCYFEL